MKEISHVHVITDQDEIKPIDFSSLVMKVAETIDAFIFEIVLPYCSEVEQRVVTKEELIKALKLLREQEQKE